MPEFIGPDGRWGNHTTVKSLSGEEVRIRTDAQPSNESGRPLLETDVSVRGEHVSCDQYTSLFAARVGHTHLCDWAKQQWKVIPLCDLGQDAN